MNFQHFQKPTSSALLIILFISLLIFLALLFQQNQIPAEHHFNTCSKTNWMNYTLSEAASKIAQNNTLIVCTVSEPFLGLFDNWLISVTKHNHQGKVLIIAEDYPTLLRVNNKWPGHAVLLSPQEISNNDQTGYKFGSKGFKNLTDKRVRYLLHILELGYNVMFNDVDMVWLEDPFPYMKNEEYDIYFTDDRDDVRPLNHSHDLPPKAKDGTTYICACMIYTRPTKGSKMLMTRWIEEIRHGIVDKVDNDQLAFNRAINKLVGQVNMYLLPQTRFPSGALYFWNRDWANKNQGKQVIVHANYIVGLEEKIRHFRESGLWFVDDHAFESPLGTIY